MSVNAVDGFKSSNSNNKIKNKFKLNSILPNSRVSNSNSSNQIVNIGPIRENNSIIEDN